MFLLRSSHLQHGLRGDTIMNAYFLHLRIMKMRQVMNVQRNIEERSRNHCRRGK